MDARLWFLLSNTFWLSAAACAVAVPPGVILALLLVRTDVPLRRAAGVVLVLAFFIPLYLHAAAWQAGFGVQGGATLALGLPGWVDGFAGAAWVLGVANIPWVAAIVGAALLLVDPAWEEQALLDASSRQVFVRVTLRHVLPAAGLAALWVAVVSAGDMLVSSLFMVRTYAEELYTRWAIGPELDEPALGTGAGVLLSAGLVLAGICVCLALAVPGRQFSLRRRATFALGRWRAAAALVVLGLIGIIALVPLAALVHKAGMVVVETGGERVRSFSVARCLSKIIEAPWQARRELGWSLVIGSLAALGTVAAAALLASFGLWRQQRARTVAWLAVWALAAASLAVPGPVLGLGLIHLLNRPELPWLSGLYDHSILAPWLALWVRGLPLAMFVLWHAFQTVPRSLLDAAAVDGAGPARRLLLVVVPMRVLALALAFLLAFVVGLGELAASILVVPPGVNTLSILIFDRLHSGAEDDVAGIALGLVALLAGVAATAYWLGAQAAGLRSRRSVPNSAGPPEHAARQIHAVALSENSPPRL